MVQLESLNASHKDQGVDCIGEANNNLHKQEGKFSQLSLGSKESEIIEFDLKLIEETRQLIKQEFEQSQANGLDIYSKKHYETILASNATCWRYVIHCNKKPKDAFELIKQALIWRKEQQVDKLDARLLAKDFWHKAPIGFVGKCRDGHGLVYIVGRNYRKAASAELKKLISRFILYLLIGWDNQRLESMEQFVVVFDCQNTTLINIDVDFVRWLISIVDYLPARFFAIHVNGIPFLVRPLVRLIISWLPDRYKRICYCGTKEQLIANVVDEDNLPAEVGGTAPDIWRLAPIEAPWAEESEHINEKLLKLLDESICFNTPKERIESLKKMQCDYEASYTSNGKSAN